MDRLQLLISLNEKYKINLLSDDDIVKEFMKDISEYYEYNVRFIIKPSTAVAVVIGKQETVNKSFDDIKEGYTKIYQKRKFSSLHKMMLKTITLHHLTDEQLLQLKLLQS
jgi:hypothetical protein